MGYGMAVNLRSKLDNDWTFLICDVDSQAIERFKSEMQGQGPVEVVKNGFEAVKAAVRFWPSTLLAANRSAGYLIHHAAHRRRRQRSVS